MKRLTLSEEHKLKIAFKEQKAFVKTEIVRVYKMIRFLEGSLPKEMKKSFNITSFVFTHDKMIPQLIRWGGMKSL